MLTTPFIIILLWRGYDKRVEVNAQTVLAWTLGGNWAANISVAFTTRG
jgi:hypothetical protein